MKLHVFVKVLLFIKLLLYDYTIDFPIVKLVY